MIKIFESHAHLQYLKNDLENILSRAKQVHVEKIVTIATDKVSLIECREIAEKYPHIYFSCGVHPHDAKGWDDDLKNFIEDSLKHPKAIAVGETGLDYHYNLSEPKIQRQAFEWHLQLAKKIGKPLIIHCRDAAEDLLNLIRKAAPFPAGGVVHCFVEDQKTADELLSLGFMLGFTGIITFKNAQAICQVLKNIPMESILVETDTPFLAPVPHRGKTNEPAYLVEIIQKISEIKQLPVAAICQQSWENGHRLFKLPL